MSSNEQIIFDEAYNTALTAAIQASKLILHYWPNPLNPYFDQKKVLKIFEKDSGTGNYATIADTESEELIIKMIRENSRLKNHSILAEESGEDITRSDYLWIIDPIDGTLNFRNGMTDFGISIGIVYNNEPIIGILAIPALDHIIVARKGEGVKLISTEKKQLLDLTQITYTQPLDKTLIAYDLGYENRAEQMRSATEKIADKVAYTVCYASSSASNYRMAMGSIGAYFHKTPTKYDVAAASIIVTEAGGVVTDIHGDPIDWHAPRISYLGARTPVLHQQLLELLNK